MKAIICDRCEKSVDLFSEEIKQVDILTKNLEGMIETEANYDLCEDCIAELFLSLQPKKTQKSDISLIM